MEILFASAYMFIIIGLLGVMVNVAANPPVDEILYHLYSTIACGIGVLIIVALILIQTFHL